MATASGLITTVKSAVDEHAPELDQLRERADELLDRAELRERVEGASVAVREGLTDLEPLARRTAISMLEAFQAVLRVAFLLPRLALRLFGLVRTAAVYADDVRDRGFEWTERARDAARSVPPSRRGRWRRRGRTLAVFSAGLTVGAALGWLLGCRRRVEADQDAPVLLQPVGGDSGPDGDQGTSDDEEAGSGT